MAAATERWWSKDTIAVVTGGNKGIGYEIVKKLSKSGVTTVLTARDTGRGQQAVDSLKAEGYEAVVFHPLDVTSAKSAEELATWLKKEFGGIDILINNAGIATWTVNYEEAKKVLDTNYYGVKIVTAKLLPVLRPGGRIVDVSSGLGFLNILGSKTLASELDDESKLSEEIVDSYAAKYLESVKAGTWKADGWAATYPVYSDSKVLLNAYIRSLAKRLASPKSEFENISVNAICPGYVATDLNNNSGTGTAESGADTPVWLALLPAKNYPTGLFYKDRALHSYYGVRS